MPLSELPKDDQTCQRCANLSCDGMMVAFSNKKPSECEGWHENGRSVRERADKRIAELEAKLVAEVEGHKITAKQHVDARAIEGCLEKKLAKAERERDEALRELATYREMVANILVALKGGA